MANVTQFVKPPSSRGRYPFDRLVDIGDYFDVVPCTVRSLSVTVSHEHHGDAGRQIRVFKIAGGGRVMLVDAPPPAVPVIMEAHVDYGDHRPARIWGEFTAETVETFFREKAGQCFGIRKSIMGFRLETIEPAALPAPWADMPGAAAVLQHNGDTIVWNAAGDKIKTEFQ